MHNGDAYDTHNTYDAYRGPAYRRQTTGRKILSTNTNIYQIKIQPSLLLIQLNNRAERDWDNFTVEVKLAPLSRLGHFHSRSEASHFIGTGTFSQ